MTTLPVLYSFRRCPYAMRARWSLLNSGLMVECREVSLRSKPQALLEASAKGTVPVLVLPSGQVIDESLAVMHWALAQADPLDLLATAMTADQRACISAVIARNDAVFKHHLDRFKYADRYPGACRDEHHSQGLLILRDWAESVARSGWLVGDRCTLADAAVWPFVRQWRIADPDGFDRCEDLLPLRQWLDRFLDSGVFSRLMQRWDPWMPGDPPLLFPADAEAVSLTQPLFHLALARDWHQALEDGVYRISTRGRTLNQEGFIHASTAEQLSDTYRRFYADAGDVLLLRLDPQLLPMPLRADPSPTGDCFPHLYGELPVDRVIHVSRYEDG